MLAIGVAGLVPTLLALIAGIELRGRISAARFRQVIAVILVASVANLLWRTLAG